MTLFIAFTKEVFQGTVLKFVIFLIFLKLPLNLSTALCVSGWYIEPYLRCISHDSSKALIYFLVISNLLSVGMIFDISFSIWNICYILSLIYKADLVFSRSAVAHFEEFSIHVSIYLYLFLVRSNSHIKFISQSSLIFEGFIAVCFWFYEYFRLVCKFYIY